jgi:hypothetical protein
MSMRTMACSFVQQFEQQQVARRLGKSSGNLPPQRHEALHLSARVLDQRREMMHVELHHQPRRMRPADHLRHPRHMRRRDHRSRVHMLIPAHRQPHAVEPRSGDCREMRRLNPVAPIALARRLECIAEVHAAPHRERRRLRLAHRLGRTRRQRRRAKESFSAIHPVNHSR